MMTSSSTDRPEGWTTANYNDHFKGIPQKRSCTDFYCLAVLLVFVFCWSAVGYYAYYNGDISRLIAPKDTMGRTCGVDEDVADSKYLLFFDLSKCVSMSVFIFGCPTKQVCVKQCPNNNWFSTETFKNPPSQIMWRTVQEKLICNDSSIARSVNSLEALKKVIDEERCASYYVRSTSAFFNLCLPNLGFAAKGISVDIAENSETAQNYFSYAYNVSNLIQEDLRKCWHFIVFFISASLLASLFVIIIMGIITKIVIWITLALVLIFLLYSSIITFMQYDSMPETDPNGMTNGFYSETAYGQLQWLFQQRQTWLILFIVSVSFFGLFSLLVIFLRSRIELAVMLIGEGSKAINRIKSTLCFPFVTRLLQLVIILWFLAIFFYVKSLGNTVYTVKGLNETDSDCVCRNYKENDWCLPHKFQEDCHTLNGKEACITAGCLFKEFRHPKMKYYFHLYNLFGLLWGLYFVAGVSRMVLSFSFATWYWTYNKYDIPFFTLFYSIFITFRYHLGTIALGSFLIATCGFIRTLLEHTQRILKQSDGLLSQCLTWSMRCCFWCLQKFLIFLSNNAYVMCAIMGTSFFSSAGEALGLLARNIVRVVVLDKVLDFLMLIGKLSVTLLMGSLSYFAFSRDTLNLHYPIVPTAIVAIVVWIISSSFFGVYEVAVDTLFLSFLKDGEINDGSQNKPYYMSHKLKYMLKENLKANRRKIRDE